MLKKKINEQIYKINLKKVLKSASDKLLDITMEEVQKEKERRKKERAKK